jgi:hypothetical protein
MGDKVELPIKRSSKRATLLRSVDLFYDDIDNFKQLQCLLGRSQMSLRLLDYFCATYAGEHGVCITMPDGKIQSLHDIYQARLNRHGKVLYDAFRRSEKLVYTKHDVTLETTLGQLVFFRDVIQYRVNDYIEAHQDQIKEAMSKDAVAITKAKEQSGGRCKRRSGRKAPKPYIHKRKVIIKFNH